MNQHPTFATANCLSETSHTSALGNPNTNSTRGRSSAANDTSTPASTGVAGFARFAFRAPLIFGAVLGAVGEPLIRQSSPETTRRIVQRWARTILSIAGAKVSIKGRPPQGIGLFVSNHRSYIDILALLHSVPVAYLCKKEVVHWPLIGNVATRMGVVYVDRNNRESRSSTLNAVADAVLDATSVVAFPEGTTHAGPGLGPTRPGLFRVAEMREFALFPVVIEYDDPHDAWVGDDTLLRHVRFWLSKPSSHLTVSFGDPVQPQSGGAPLHTQTIVERWMRTELEKSQSAHQAGRRRNGRIGRRKFVLEGFGHLVQTVNWNQQTRQQVRGVPHHSLVVPSG